MDTFTIHADFNKIDGTPSKTKWVRVITSAQVVGPDGEIFDDADIPLTAGVLDVKVPANTNEPTDGFTYTVLRERGKTRLWRVPVQAPDVVVELSEYTETQPLVIPPNQQGATKPELDAVAGRVTVVEADLAGLTPGDVGADPAGTATAAVTAHVAAADPHGDRAFAIARVAEHVATLDPHADRAYTDDRIAEVSTAVTSEATARASAVVTEATARIAADLATLAQAKAYTDAAGVNLSALIALAEESEDIAELATEVAALAAAPPEVSQGELDAEAAARATGDTNTLAAAAGDATSKANAAQTAAAADATTKANAAQAAASALASAANANADTRILETTKGAPSGVAPLDASSAVPDANLQSRLVTLAKAIVANLNNQTSTGWVCASSATANIPEAGGFYNVHVIGYQYANYATQIAYSAVGIDVWRRQQNNGVWTAWVRIDRPSTYFAPPTMRGIPGQLVYTTGTWPLVANTPIFTPWATEEYVALTEARAEVTTASAGGGRLNVAVYRADSQGQPIAGGLVADFGELAIDTTGVKTAVLGTPVTLPPGRYVTRLVISAAATLRTFGYSSDKFQNILNTMGGSPFRTMMFVTQAYSAAAPANPAAWTGANFGTNGAWLSMAAFGYTVAA